MRVLLIDVNCQYSSTGKIVYALYSQLNANGHTAAIAYGRGAKIAEDNIFRFSPMWEIYLHALLTRLTGYTGCFSKVATKRLINFIDEFKPDVVHLNDIHGYFVNIIPLLEYLKKKEIKVIWTFHCEFMYTGKCGHSYECDKWKSECGKCPHLDDYPKSLLFDRTSKMLAEKKKVFSDFGNLIIVSPSNWLASRIKASFLKNKSILTIYNGIDTEIFHPRNPSRLRKELGLTNEKIVLAVAPDLLSPNKGGEYVLQIAHNMKAMNIKFIMIGITDLNHTFEENIIPVGKIKNQILLAEYYSLADVFIICSKRETYPTTCIEASACDAPIVGFDVGGVSETANPGRGIFVSYGNLDEMQKAIEHFLYEFVDSIPNANHITNRDYSMQKMYVSYLKVYSR